MPRLIAIYTRYLIQTRRGRKLSKYKGKKWGKCKRCHKDFHHGGQYANCYECRKKNRERKHGMYRGGMPARTQLALVRAIENGKTNAQIIRSMGMREQTVNAFRRDPEVNFRPQAKTICRCGGCGCRIKTEVCILCEVHNANDAT